MYTKRRIYRVPCKSKQLIFQHSAISDGLHMSIRVITTGSLLSPVSDDKFISYYEPIDDKRWNVPAWSCDIPWLFLASLFATLFGVAILPLTNSAHELGFVTTAHALWPGAY